MNIIVTASLKKIPFVPSIQTAVILEDSFAAEQCKVGERNQQLKSKLLTEVKSRTNSECAQPEHWLPYKPSCRHQPLIGSDAVQDNHTACDNAEIRVISWKDIN